MLALAATPHFSADPRSPFVRSRERQRVDIRRLAFAGLHSPACWRSPLRPIFPLIPDRLSRVAASASEWCFDDRPQIPRRWYFQGQPWPTPIRQECSPFPTKREGAYARLVRQEAFCCVGYARCRLLPVLCRPLPRGSGDRSLVRKSPRASAHGRFSSPGLIIDLAASLPTVSGPHAVARLCHSSQRRRVARPRPVPR